MSKFGWRQCLLLGPITGRRLFMRNQSLLTTTLYLGAIICPTSREVITVTPTQSESVTTVDKMWEHELILANQVESIYNELFYPAPRGSKRKARYDAVNTEIENRKRGSGLLFGPSDSFL
mmetsp:Transcript_1739/g.2388  ORF Transcript_1739/g.2388 Transcript_1739/m.2388 type:complete len:120 (+) Transcript_1739:711-1070(+)